MEHGGFERIWNQKCICYWTRNMIKPKHNWKWCFWHGWHGPCCCASDSLLVGAPVQRGVGFWEDGVNLTLRSPGEDTRSMKKRKRRKLRDEEKKWWETAKWREEETLHKRIMKEVIPVKKLFIAAIIRSTSPVCFLYLPTARLLLRLSLSFCPVLHSVWFWGVLLLWNIPLCCRLQIWECAVCSLCLPSSFCVFISVSDCFYLCVVACLFQSDSSTCLTLSSFDF